MILFKKAKDLRKYLAEQREKGHTTGFVPTMGALHTGHISLIRLARENNDCCVCSIFVNPTQFNDPADFKKYPITIENDILQLENAGCDVLFLPDVEEIYPQGTALNTHYELGYLETILEGKYRPGHFQGVCAVVDRLLDIVQPDALFLGQKDYQQCIVIKKLMELTGIAAQTALHISPTLREENGLAMSSRNMRLSESEKEKAAVIFASLNHIKQNLNKESLVLLQQGAVESIEKAGLKVDYVTIADATDLTPAGHDYTKQKLVVVAAAYMGEVRLIDNLLLN